MPQYSFIIPVYNRPEELHELLETIEKQKFNDFEVIIIEDGSLNTSRHVCDQFSNSFTIKYIVQENKGPGPARNNGAEVATGRWLIFLDSDCLLPENYLDIVDSEVGCEEFDCFGGPDKAHPAFNTIQKAIGYAMSSILTTGGIRGAKEKLDIFYPRSYNLGVRKSVFMAMNGFSSMRFGEDLDFSMRLLEKGYSTRLVKKAFVFHKRRNNFHSFFKQIFNSGIARINLEIRHPKTLKLVHWVPLLFIIGHVGILVFAVMNSLFLLLLLVVPLIIFFDALYATKAFRTSLWAIPAAYTQTFGYGLGFLKAFVLRILLKKKEFHDFEQNFYN